MDIQMVTENWTYMDYRLYLFWLTIYSLWFVDYMFWGSWSYFIHSVHWDIFGATAAFELQDGRQRISHPKQPYFCFFSPRKYSWLGWLLCCLCDVAWMKG